MQQSSPFPFGEGEGLHGLFVLGRDVGQCQIPIGVPTSISVNSKTGRCRPKCPSSRRSESQFYQEIARIRTTSGNLWCCSCSVSQLVFSYPTYTTSFESIEGNMGELIRDVKESGSNGVATHLKSSDAPISRQRGHSSRRAGKPRTARRATACEVPQSTTLTNGKAVNTADVGRRKRG
jgi:hypothetical protein